MATTKLKRSLGTDGQSLTDESHGADGLKAVLQALARAIGIKLSAFTATPAVAVLDAFLVGAGEAGEYDLSLALKMGTTGTTTDTTLDLMVNGVSAGQVVVLNTDTDGTANRSDGVAVTLAEDDYVTLEVTTIPTGGADLAASARLSPLDVE